MLVVQKSYEMFLNFEKNNSKILNIFVYIKYICIYLHYYTLSISNEYFVSKLIIFL